MSGWTNKLQYGHTMNYDSTLKRNEVLIHATVWLNLKDILLSKSSQSRKATNCMIPLIGNIRNRYNRHKNLIPGHQGWGDGGRDVIANEFLFGMTKCPGSRWWWGLCDSVNILKPPNCILLKSVNYISARLLFKKKNRGTVWSVSGKTEFRAKKKY